MTIEPDMEMRRWAVQQTITVLANADYYYTKTEVDKLLEEITSSGVTREEVEEMIQRAIATKADNAAVEALAAQVAENTLQILNRYTKEETNSLLSAYLTKLKANEMFANYTKVEGTTLLLNADNVGITI
jgi:predicted transcriptional regulator